MVVAKDGTLYYSLQEGEYSLESLKDIIAILENYSDEHEYTQDTIFHDEKGNTFRCPLCGCNVFRKSNYRPNIVRCNGCREEYETEPLEKEEKHE